MKIFETNDGGWSEKINFVDDNNVFVGFDYGQSCCEQFGYCFSNNPESGEDLNLNVDKLSGYNFDITFEDNFEKERNSYMSVYKVGSAAFKLTKSGNPDIFLILYNCHNGYYSHGFKFVNGEAVITNGSL